jgi:hypothetical protein
MSKAGDESDGAKALPFKKGRFAAPGAELASTSGQNQGTEGIVKAR